MKAFYAISALYTAILGTVYGAAMVGFLTGNIVN